MPIAKTDLAAAGAGRAGFCHASGTTLVRRVLYCAHHSEQETEPGTQAAQTWDPATPKGTGAQRVCTEKVLGDGSGQRPRLPADLRGRTWHRSHLDTEDTHLHV